MIFAIDFSKIFIIFNNFYNDFSRLSYRSHKRFELHLSNAVQPRRKERSSAQGWNFSVLIEIPLMSAVSMIFIDFVIFSYGE